MSVLRIEKLSHKYSTQWANKNISLEVNSSGIFGLLGSNGAGKSTLMNIICGVLKKTKGLVCISGINLEENSVEAKKNVGFLPQKPPLHTDMTVRE